MFLWFLVLAPVLVAEVFRSPLVDYRLVALGAVVPLIDVLVGGVSALHSLATSVGLLALVMVATMAGGPVGRRLGTVRLWRRRLLGLPIGMFLHLTLDGSFATARLFWWPAFGWSLSEVELPEAGRVGVRLLLEAAAVLVAAWAYRRYGLDLGDNRRRLIRTGHLTRQAVS